MEVNEQELAEGLSKLLDMAFQKGLAEGREISLPEDISSDPKAKSGKDAVSGSSQPSPAPIIENQINPSEVAIENIVQPADAIIENSVVFDTDMIVSAMAGIEFDDAGIKEVLEKVADNLGKATENDMDFGQIAEAIEKASPSSSIDNQTEALTSLVARLEENQSDTNEKLQNTLTGLTEVIKSMSEVVSGSMDEVKQQQGMLEKAILADRVVVENEQGRAIRSVVDKSKLHS